MHLCVGSALGKVGGRDALLEYEGEGFLEGLAEVSSHEGVHNRVDRGVGVGHAVSPDLHLVDVVVTLKAGAEGLHQDVELDGAPAEGKEKHHHSHHAGDLGSHRLRAPRQQLQLEVGRRLKLLTSFMKAYVASNLISFVFTALLPFYE